MRLLIFDFDGTLADTFAEIANSLNETRSAFDLPPVDPDRIRRWIGYGLRHFMVNALPDESHDDAAIERFTRTYKKIYAKAAFENAKLFDGMLEVLDAVSDDVLAVVSNKSEEQLIPMLHHLGIFDRFTAVVGGNTTAFQKPDRRIYDHLVEQIPMGFETVWMIGDSEPDVQLGVAIKATAVGCSWGLRERADLEAAGAHFIVERPAELLELLIKS